MFAGTVITGHVQGALWKVWPNGHPVVRTASGCDLDVVALVHDRMARGQPGLAALYADTAAGRLP